MKNITILDLPSVVTNEISKFLPTRDLLNAAETGKDGLRLFKTNQNSRQTIIIRKFLHHVVRCNHIAVAEMLENPELMIKRGQVTDLSGRIFTNISGFEYALWALDKHMWTKMLASLPKNEQGEKIKGELRQQYQKVKDQGVTYTLHGVTEHYMPDTVTKTEQHFDFKGTILQELQKYIDKDDDHQWRTGVGGAQRLFPAYLAYEYCSDTPFYPTPDFKEQPQSSKEFSTWLKDGKNDGKKESWFCKGSKLGFDFAIHKDAFKAEVGRRAPAPMAERDLNAVKALCQVRTNDFCELENDLEPCNLSENQYKN